MKHTPHIQRAIQGMENGWETPRNNCEMADNLKGI